MADRTALTARLLQTRPRGGRPPGAGQQSNRAWAIAVRAALPVALLLWLLSLRRVALDKMADLGLIQVLPVLFWVALVLLTVGFGCALHDRGIRQGWLAGYLLGLIGMIHATPALLYPELRYAWAWKHVAVVDAMLRHGGPVPDAQGLDIYNQWPGFFVLNWLVLKVTGLHSALGYANWAPVVVNALLVAPLLLLYRAVTRDRRLVWGGVWIFFSCSWVGQDYFAPQAFAFVLYVVVLAMVLRQLPGPGKPSKPGKAGSPGLLGPGDPAGDERGASPWRLPQRADGGWLVRLPLVLLIEAVIVSSHQLTPVMLVCTLIALAIPRRNRRVVLPALAGALVLMVLWDSTVARPYLAANLHDFLSALTRPDGNVTSGLAGLGAAAPGQVIVDWVDRGLSAAVFVLAVLALVRRPWVRRTGIPLLAIAPLPMLAANSYGGEMVFRVYLFALPATAFLAATLLLQRGPRPRLRAVGVVAVLLAMIGGLLFGYESKEAMNYFSTKEVAATRFVLDTAPPGALIVTVTGDAPGSAFGYDHHNRIQMIDGPPEIKARLAQNPLAGLQSYVTYTTRGTPAYLILNRAQAAECFLTGVFPADTVARLDAAAAGSPRFTLVYRNSDAVVYRFVPNP
ncbi:hypothetical protein [Kitasatospora azatica]|uniref:hypothetical protein n=1 Tax=Kitasatospora azatica TaxID=58347 RepID=UPI00068C58ED|nr:hypothetical protein [Kitasatospora azatica]